MLAHQFLVAREDNVFLSPHVSLWGLMEGVDSAGTRQISNISYASSSPRQVASLTCRCARTRDFNTCTERARTSVRAHDRLQVAVDEHCSHWGGYSDKIYLADAGGAEVAFGGSTPRSFIDFARRWVEHGAACLERSGTAHGGAHGGTSDQYDLYVKLAEEDEKAGTQRVRSRRLAPAPAVAAQATPKCPWVASQRRHVCSETKSPLTWQGTAASGTVAWDKKLTNRARAAGVSPQGKAWAHHHDDQARCRLAEPLQPESFLQDVLEAAGVGLSPVDFRRTEVRYTPGRQRPCVQGIYFKCSPALAQHPAFAVCTS